MPQSSDEMHELMKYYFGDEIDEQGPMEFLKKRGFVLRDDWHWIHPEGNNHFTSLKEELCVRFLIEEWDFGGIIMNTSGPKDVSHTQGKDFEGADPVRRSYTEAGLEANKRINDWVVEINTRDEQIARLKNQLVETERTYQHLLKRYQTLQQAMNRIKNWVKWAGDKMP